MRNDTEAEHRSTPYIRFLPFTNSISACNKILWWKLTYTHKIRTWSARRNNGSSAGLNRQNTSGGEEVLFSIYSTSNDGNIKYHLILCSQKAMIFWFVALGYQAGEIRTYVTSLIQKPISLRVWLPIHTKLYIQNIPKFFLSNWLKYEGRLK